MFLGVVFVSLIVCFVNNVYCADEAWKMWDTAKKYSLYTGFGLTAMSALATKRGSNIAARLHYNYPAMRSSINGMALVHDSASDVIQNGFQNIFTRAGVTSSNAGRLARSMRGPVPLFLTGMYLLGQNPSVCGAASSMNLRLGGYMRTTRDNFMTRMNSPSTMTDSEMFALTGSMLEQLNVDIDKLNDLEELKIVEFTDPIDFMRALYSDYDGVTAVDVFIIEQVSTRAEVEEVLFIM